MIRLRVIFSVRAEMQLDALEEYVARQSSPLTASRYAQRIRKACVRLGDAPFQGQVVRHRPAKLRKVGFEHSITILFAPLEDVLLITSILYRGHNKRFF